MCALACRITVLLCLDSASLLLCGAEYTNPDEILPRNLCVIARLKAPSATSASGRPVAHWKTQPGGKPSLTYVCAKCSKRGDHLVEDCTSAIKASPGAGIPTSIQRTITESQAELGVRWPLPRALGCGVPPLLRKSYCCDATTHGDSAAL